MLILGIDPGLQITGYGFLEVQKEGFRLKAAGHIKTRAEDGMPRRLYTIYRSLAELIDIYRPDALVLEKLYAHYKHPITASLLGHARGVICMLADEKKISFFEYPATRVKKITTGSGHASKMQIQKMIEHTMGVKADSLGPADTTDAISLAVTHAYLIRINPVRDIKSAMSCGHKQIDKTLNSTMDTHMIRRKHSINIKTGVSCL